MKPAPKPAARSKGRKPRKTWRPPAAAVEDLKKQRRRVYVRQGGVLLASLHGPPVDISPAPCAGKCRRWFRLRQLELSHRKFLGRRATRWDRSHPLNDDSNVDLRCRACHVAWENEQRRAHAAERDELARQVGAALKGRRQP